MSEKLLLILLNFNSNSTVGLSLTGLSEWEGQNEGCLEHQHIFLAVDLPP